MEKQQGLSLLEVMLASLIVSFSLVGFLQGELMALHVSEQAYFINLANLKGNELVERVRSCSNKPTCIQMQLNFWEREINKIFPEGKGIAKTRGSDYQIKISWSSIYHSRFYSCLLFRL